MHSIYIYIYDTSHLRVKNIRNWSVVSELPVVGSAFYYDTAVSSEKKNVLYLNTK
jgi:hypothetical protein